MLKDKANMLCLDSDWSEGIGEMFIPLTRMISWLAHSANSFRFVGLIPNYAVDSYT